MIVKTIQIAELNCADDTAWHLQQLKSGLETLKRHGKVLLVAGTIDGRLSNEEDGGPCE